MNEDVELFRSGRLSEAISALAIFIKRNPSDIEARSRLVEYHCVATEYEKAERQLEIIASIDPKTSVRVVEIRQLLRAAMARKALWKYGRAPELLSPLPEHAQSRLRAVIAMRDADYRGVEEYLLLALQQRPEFELLIDDKIVTNFRDLDDFVADVLEVYTPTGKYLWIPFQEISEAIFSQPKRPIDFAFIPVELTLFDGTSGCVYIPCIYNPLNESPEERYLTGRETDWRDEQASCRGIGLRCFLKDDESISLFEIKTIRSIK